MSRTAGSWWRAPRASAKPSKNRGTSRALLHRGTRSGADPGTAGGVDVHLVNDVVMSKPDVYRHAAGDRRGVALRRLDLTRVCRTTDVSPSSTKCAILGMPAPFSARPMPREQAAWCSPRALSTSTTRRPSGRRRDRSSISPSLVASRRSRRWSGPRRTGVPRDGWRRRGGSLRRRLVGPIAFVFGNEAHGLPAEVRTLADNTVSVPHQREGRVPQSRGGSQCRLFEWARRLRGGSVSRDHRGCAAHDIRSPLTAMKASATPSRSVGTP